MKTIEQDNAWFGKDPVTRFLKENYGILIGLVCLCLVLTFTTDNRFLTANNLISVLRQICINALIAFGMTFVLIVGGIDLTVGSVVGASGVAVVMLLERGMNMWMAIACGLLLGVVIGGLNGLIITMIGMPPFIVTLSMQGVIRGIAYYITDGRSVACNNKLFTSMGNGYFWGVPIPIYIVAAIMLILSVVLYHTKFGRRMYAVGGNSNAAKFTGIKTNSVTIKVYIISAVMASIAGIILASRMYSGQPTAGQNYESDAIAAAVLGGTSFTGGIGRLGGTLIGALVIGVLSNGLNLLHISSYMQMVIKGAVIVLAVAFDLLKNKKITSK